MRVEWKGWRAYLFLFLFSYAQLKLKSETWFGSDFVAPNRRRSWYRRRNALFLVLYRARARCKARALTSNERLHYRWFHSSRLFCLKRCSIEALVHSVCTKNTFCCFHRFSAAFSCPFVSVTGPICAHSPDNNMSFELFRTRTHTKQRTAQRTISRMEIV